VEGFPTVATINGEPIWLKDLEREIEMVHMSQDTADRKLGRQNPTKILDRMVTARLLSQEARSIGLDEQPEAKQELERVRLETLRDLYNREVLKNVKADPAAVQRMYRDEIAEYRARSILFAKEADYKEFQAKLKAGTDFDTAVVTFANAKKGLVGNAQDWLKASQMQLPVLQEIRKLKVGGVSPMVRIESGWVYFKLLETRFPDSPAAREMVEANALGEARDKALAAHIDGLRKKLVTFDEALIKSLDVDKPAVFEAARKDNRPLVTIRGGAPITVADLTVGLEKRFFHGIEQAMQAKRMSAEKRQVLEDLVNRRIIVQDAQRMGIDKTQEYGVVVDRKMNAYLFGAIVQKVIAPEVKIQRSDLEAYLKEHQAEYMSPAMVELEAIAFGDRKAADEALGKLQRGADFAWVKANTTGQVAKNASEPEGFQPGLHVEATLPAGMQKAIAGTRPNDYRFYGEGNGPYYVLHVLRREPAKPTPLESVQDKIGKIVFQDRMGRQIDEWGTKLRKASEIKTFATGDELLKLVMRDLAAGS
jgi:parvulin-like peptidyl-prolyl isomerase